MSEDFEGEDAQSSHRVEGRQRNHKKNKEGRHKEGKEERRKGNEKR